MIERRKPTPAIPYPHHSLAVGPYEMHYRLHGNGKPFVETIQPVMMEALEWITNKIFLKAASSDRQFTSRIIRADMVPMDSFRWNLDEFKAAGGNESLLRAWHKRLRPVGIYEWEGCPGIVIIWKMLRLMQSSSKALDAACRRFEEMFDRAGIRSWFRVLPEDEVLYVELASVTDRPLHRDWSAVRPGTRKMYVSAPQNQLPPEAWFKQQGISLLSDPWLHKGYLPRVCGGRLLESEEIDKVLGQMSERETIPPLLATIEDLCGFVLKPRNGACSEHMAYRSPRSGDKSSWVEVVKVLRWALEEKEDLILSPYIDARRGPDGANEIWRVYLCREDNEFRVVGGVGMGLKGGKVHGTKEAVSWAVIPGKPAKSK